MFSGGKQKRDSASADVSSARQEENAQMLQQITELLQTQSNDLKGHMNEVKTELTAKLDSTAKQVAHLEEVVKNLQQSLKKVEDDSKAKDGEIADLRQHVAQLRTQLNATTASAEEAEAKAARRSNLVVFGIPESVEASALPNFVRQRIAQAMGSGFNERDIIDAFRLGRRQASRSGRPRPVLIKFSSVAVRDAAMRHKRSLTTESGGKLFLDSDLTPSQQKQKRALGGTFRVLKQSGHRPFWRDAVLFWYPDPSSQRHQQHPANSDPSKRLDPVVGDQEMRDAAAAGASNSQQQTR